MNTKNNTLLGMELCDFTYRDMCVLHIPHSSTHIPDKSGYNEKLDNEIIKFTDWATDEIFNLPITKSIVNFSRIFCDVERFVDNEPMEKFGRGYYYTKTDDGEVLRTDDNKEYVLENYYIPHHEEFNKMVEEKLRLYNKCIIIDCHSFTDIPFNSDLIKDDNRPDICLGVDDYHTPNYMLDYYKNEFIKRGFTVKINNPYSGTIVNSESYLKDDRVNSIMIEINRKLYMDNDKVLDDKVKYLNDILKDIIN